MATGLVRYAMAATGSPDFSRFLSDLFVWRESSMKSTFTCRWFSPPEALESCRQKEIFEKFIKTTKWYSGRFPHVPTLPIWKYWQTGEDLQGKKLRAFIAWKVSLFAQQSFHVEGHFSVVFPRVVGFFPDILISVDMWFSLGFRVNFSVMLFIRQLFSPSASYVIFQHAGSFWEINRPFVVICMLTLRVRNLRSVATLDEFKGLLQHCNHRRCTSASFCNSDEHLLQ